MPAIIAKDKNIMERYATLPKGLKMKFTRKIVRNVPTRNVLSFPI